MSVPNPDKFLDGRVVADQRGAGFRSGLDAVMLAASVPAGAGETALELGSGAGVASLCLAARVPGCEIWGLEIDPALVRLATANAAANNAADRVHFLAGDALQPPPELRHEFQHVFCNPPFHAGEGQTPPAAARARALHDAGTLPDWLAAGLKRTASGGSFTAILRADRLGEALAALPERGLAILPLWPKAGGPSRQGEAAKRVVVQCRKGARAPLALLPGLVLHEADGRYTPRADAILRGRETLSFLA